MGVQVDKMVHMVGSYAPKAEPHSYLTPFEDAPSGKLGRGTYKVGSCFTDDYKNEHLKVIHHNYTYFDLNWNLGKKIVKTLSANYQVKFAY